MGTPSANRTYDGFKRNTGQKTEIMPFRIYSSQKELLSNCYTGNSSILIRLLLEHYFAGKLPEVAQEYLNITRSGPAPTVSIAEIVKVYEETGSISEAAYNVGVSQQRVDQILNPKIK